MKNENSGEITNAMIGEVLKKVRREKGLTQKDVADDLNVSQSYISAVELGKRTASADFVIKLVKYYRISYESVFGSNPCSEPKKNHEEEPLRLFLEGTGCEDSAEIYLDICRYIMVRTLYRLNPFNSDRIFSFPKETAVKIAKEQAEKCCENLCDYLKKHKDKCKNLEMPSDYSKYLLDLVSRVEKIIR